MSQDFVHLHVHTEYSLLDGITPIPMLVKRASELGMRAVAMTDHGVMFGLVKFFKAAKKEAIKPILGCEIYVAPRTMDDKEHPYDKYYTHLLLLVKNETGYRNLTKIVSYAHTRGFYYKPRADRALLEELSDGLIACSACLGGQVARLITNDKYEEAKEAALWHQKTFGEGNYYLEMMEHGLEGQSKVNKALIEMSKELSIPLVVTNDVHYLTQEGAKVQDVMMCIQKGKTLAEANTAQERQPNTEVQNFYGSKEKDEETSGTDKFSFESKEFYLKTAEEMSRVFPNNPEALAATCDIADSIDFDLPLGNIFLPFFEVPKGKTDNEYLHDLTMKGLEKKYSEITDEIKDRAEFELGVIDRMNYPAYFLIVWDLMRFAREKDIPVGPGRGSAAGSLVAYALDITEVDPLKYGLQFERFLNPDRISMPDIDMDFCYERREEIIDYAKQKYGEDKVAMIITFGRLKARFAIRDVGRVLGVDLPTVDRLAKMVPTVIPDKKVTIENAIDYNPDLKMEYDNDPRIRELLDYSKQIEGLARNTSTHAAGVVISKYPLVEHVPVYQSPSDELPMTQVPGEELEDMGLLKMDFLGLRTLTVIYDAVKHIENRTGIKINLVDLPLDDKKTYELFSSSETDGIFQFEGNTVKGLMTRMQPNRIEDLIALNALNRPGPLGENMDVTFIENRKKKTDDIDYIHPLLRPVLEETFGVMLYQEQVMKIANVIADFTLAESDTLRRAMGKKKEKEMNKLKALFIENCTKKTGDEKLAERLFGLILKFSGYGFNKSHSAAYAFLAYQTGYLKANYPNEFMAALISSIRKDTTKVAKYIEDCKRMGLVVIPPDINSGDLKFVPGDKGIIFGLGAVKNVGENAVLEIVRERRENGPYKSLFDLCSRVDLHVVNSKTIESLIRSGACDCLPGNRAQNIGAMEEALDYGRAACRDRLSGQGNLFDDDEFETPEPELPEREEFGIKTVLADEKELLGLYLSHHPLDPYKKWIKQKSNILSSDLMDLEPGDKKRVRVAGIITSKREFMTRRGQQMCVLELEDLVGKIKVTLFPDQRTEFLEELNEENVVSISGQAEARTLESANGESRLSVGVICRKLESFARGPVEKKAPPKKPVVSKVHIRFKGGDEAEKSRALIGELKNLVNSSPGEIPIIVHLDENGSGRKAVLRNNEVRYSPEFMRLAKRFFGEDNVWVETEQQLSN